MIYESYMTHFGRWRFVDAGMEIVLDDNFAATTHCCYIITSPTGEIARIGTSKRAVGLRMRETVRWLSANRAGKHPHRIDEWKKWRSVSRGEWGDLFLWANAFETPFGEIPVYLDVERELLAKHNPPLNVSSRF